MEKYKKWILLLKCSILLIALSVFFLPGIKGQTYPLTQFTEQHGVPGMTIYRVLQDHEGFLWLATNHGICRYDGQNFERIDSPELEGYEILTLSIDSKNRIWFSSFLGQVCYLDNGRVYPFGKGILPEDLNVLDLFVDSKNHIWVSSRNMIYEFKESSEEGQFSLISGTELSFGASFFNLREDINGEIITTRYTGKDTNLEVFRPKQPATPGIELFMDNPGLVYPSPSGNIFIYQAYPNTIIFELRGGKPLKIFTDLYPEMRGGCLAMIEDSAQHLWIASKRGVFHFDDDRKVLNLNNPLLDGIQVNDMIFDREGNYWFATNGEGLFFMPSRHVINYTKSNSGLADDQIYSITNDKDGRVWFGLGEGLVSRLEGADFKSYSVGAQVRVTALHWDAPFQKLYAGTDNSIYKLEKGRFSLTEFQESIKAMHPGKDNNFWVATGSNAFEVFTPSDERRLLYESRTYDVFTDAGGNTWLSTKSGMIMFRGDSATTLKLPWTDHSRIRVAAIDQSSDSTIWFATYGQGIFSYKNGKFRQYTARQGLTSNICKTITTGPDEVVWVGTDKGLNKLDLKANTILPVTKLDGLVSNMINTLHSFDGKIYVGTPHGISVFHEETNFLDTLPPLIYISKIAIADRDTTVHPEFTVPFSQKNVRIEFNGVAYRSADQLVYQHRMLGLDSSWTETKDKSLAFRRLDPGNYRFEVKAVNADGISSENTAYVDFYIQPPFSGTLWFKIIIMAGIAGLIAMAVWLSIYFTRRYQRREQAIKEKIDQLRMQALQAQMNPHFIFNALNAILHLLSVNDRKAAIKYLAMFARLIRLIFEHSKKDRIPLESEIEFLKLYLELEKLRFEEKVMVDFRVDENISPQNIRIPPLLIQPIIENAFKHGLLHKETGGLISISFKLEEDYLKCTVEDNGVGREKAKELGSWRPKDYLSSGLKTTEERLSLLNKSDDPGRQQVHMKVHDLVDPFGEPAGTKVELSIEVA